MRLHDTTRRRLCLAAFVTLCLVPTCYTVAWCVAWQLPGHLRSETQRLRDMLGLEVALDGVRHPWPGSVLYEGLRLSDPETGQPVLNARMVEAVWTRTTDAEGNRKPAALLLVSQAEIEATRVELLWRVVQRQLQRPHDGSEFELRLSAGEATIGGCDKPHTLVDVQAGLGSVPGGVQAELAFRLAGSRAGEPVRVTIARNRQVAPPSSGFELDTGDNDVPCSLLEIGLAGFEWIGPASRFRGIVRANETVAGWSGEANGQLSRVDLASLVSDHFPHKLSGLAEVTVEHARFRAGRIEEASGAITAGPGVVGRSLLAAAASHLKLFCPPQDAAMSDIVPYKRLALGFSLDARGLSLEGKCAGGPANMVLVGSEGPLLVGPTSPVPPVALIRTLVPASEVQVPAARQTDWLARHLPVPDILPPANAQPSLPHARLKQTAER